MISIAFTLTDSYLFMPGASLFFSVVYKVLFAFLFPFFAILPWAVIYMVVADKQTKKFIERGLPMR